MSHPVAARAAYQIDTGSNWCQSEATQQKSKSIPSLGAIHWLLTHCCDGARSQGVLRVRIAEVFRTKQTKIVKGGLCTIWPYQGKKVPHYIPKYIPDSTQSLISAGQGLWESGGWRCGSPVKEKSFFRKVGNG